MDTSIFSNVLPQRHLLPVTMILSVTHTSAISWHLLLLQFHQKPALSSVLDWNQTSMASWILLMLDFHGI